MAESQVAPPFQVAPLQVGILSRVADRQQDRDYYFETELPRMVFREIGLETTFQIFNYPRLVKTLNLGIVDAGSIFRFNGKFLSPNAPQFSCADQPYLGLPLIISKLSSNKDIPDQLNTPDLDNFSIGYFRSLGKDIDPFIDRPNFKPANNVSTLFKMLKSRHIDMVLADIAITKSLSRELGITTTEVFKAGFLEVFMCISHKNFTRAEAKELANDYQHALTKLYQDGVISGFLESKDLAYYQDLLLPSPLQNSSSQ